MWPWQNEVLTAYAGTSGAAAVELPTGTRETLVGLVAGEHFREGKGGRVTYLADDRQLVQQVERHGRDLGFPIVRFQGAKDSWSASGVRAFNFAEAIGVMKYWNYFNASPGVEPAGMLILNDVRLLEGPLRDLFSVFISRRGTLYTEILKLIVACDPYYSLTEDLLNGLEPMRAPEMLVSPDRAALADEVRDRRCSCGLDLRSRVGHCLRPRSVRTSRQPLSPHCGPVRFRLGPPHSAA